MKMMKCARRDGTPVAFGSYTHTETNGSELPIWPTLCQPARPVSGVRTSAAEVLALAPPKLAPGTSSEPAAASLMYEAIPPVYEPKHRLSPRLDPIGVTVHAACTSLDPTWTGLPALPGPDEGA